MTARAAIEAGSCARPKRTGSAEVAPARITVFDLASPERAGRLNPEQLRLIEQLIEGEPGARFVILASAAGVRYALATNAIAREAPLSVERIEWEYIQGVLVENGGNKTATARALKMHRRTLQRKLSRAAPVN